MTKNPTKSIRKTLQGLLLLGVSLIMFVIFMLMDYFVGDWIKSEFDQALAAKAKALVTLTKQFDNVVELDFADEFMPEFDSKKSPEYFQLWFIDQEILERSRSLGNNDLPHTQNQNLGINFADITLPDGRAGRRVEIVFYAQIENKEQTQATLMPAQQKMRLVLAKQRLSLNSTLLTLHISLILAALFMISGTYIVIQVATRLSLKPLEDIGLHMDKLDAHHLNHRLQSNDFPPEIHPALHRYNDLLDRLAIAFQREQQFSADVAHELRTPVTELINISDIAMRWPEDQQQQLMYFKDCLAASKKMQRIINQLLTLSRGAQEPQQHLTENINLTAAFNNAWKKSALSEAKKNLSFIIHGKEDISITTDTDKFELILDNLLSNATNYSVDGSLITATIKQSNGSCQIELSNTTMQLEDKDLKYIFDRLWRKDSSRADAQHSGLGLSLVKAYVANIGASVSVKLENDSYFTIIVTGLKAI